MRYLQEDVLRYILLLFLPLLDGHKSASSGPMVRQYLTDGPPVPGMRSASTGLKGLK